jgi:DNA polymerase III alpha subunit (gram-positive type)
MQHINKFLLFLGINLVITLIIPILFGSSIVDTLTSNGLWVLPLLIVLLGVLLGYIISFFMKKEKEVKAYLWGQVPSAILLLAFITNSSYNSWKYQNYERNKEANHHVMEYNVTENEPYIRSAFHTLEASFSNPNDFKLQSFHVNKQDTIYNTVQDTLYTIYFTYYLTENEEERLAKLTVLQNKINLHYAHSLAKNNREYQRTRDAFYEENKEAIEDAEKLMKQMQEKGDQVVIDSLTKVYK